MEMDPRFEIESYEDKPILFQSTSLFEKIEEIQQQVEHYQSFESLSWEVSEISVSSLIMASY